MYSYVQQFQEKALKNADWYEKRREHDEDADAYHKKTNLKIGRVVTEFEKDGKRYRKKEYITCMLCGMNTELEICAMVIEEEQ